MGRAETGLGVFGVVATLFGVGLLVAPETSQVGPVETATEAVAGAEPTRLLLVLGVGTALLVAVAVRPRSVPPGKETQQFDEVVAREPDSDSRRDDLLGFDVETAIQEGGRPWRRVRSLLADTALSAYAQREGCSLSEGRRAVEQGLWTDDTLAAGVVGDEMGVPLRARLGLWIVPERERRRRVERTTAAIEHLHEQ